MKHGRKLSEVAVEAGGVAVTAVDAAATAGGAAVAGAAEIAATAAIVGKITLQLELKRSRS